MTVIFSARPYAACSLKLLAAELSPSMWPEFFLLIGCKKSSTAPTMCAILLSVRSECGKYQEHTGFCRASNWTNNSHIKQEFAHMWRICEDVIICHSSLHTQKINILRNHVKNMWKICEKSSTLSKTKCFYNLHFILELTCLLPCRREQHNLHSLALHSLHTSLVNPTLHSSRIADLPISTHIVLMYVLVVRCLGTSLLFHLWVL